MSTARHTNNREKATAIRLSRVGSAFALGVVLCCLLGADTEAMARTAPRLLPPLDTGQVGHSPLAWIDVRPFEYLQPLPQPFD